MNEDEQSGQDEPVGPTPEDEAQNAEPSANLTTTHEPSDVDAAATTHEPAPAGPPSDAVAPAGNETEPQDPEDD